MTVRGFRLHISHVDNNINFFSHPTPAYLYGLLNVNTGVPDGAEQVVEAAHLLRQHRVHALIVAGGKAPHHCLQVKVCRQLAQDVSCHIKDHVIGGFGVSAWRAGLIRDTGRQRTDEKGRGRLVWQFIIFAGNYLSLSLTCQIMYSLCIGAILIPQKTLMLRGSDFWLDFAYISSSVCQTDLDLCF